MGCPLRYVPCLSSAFQEVYGLNWVLQVECERYTEQECRSNELLLNPAMIVTFISVPTVDKIWSWR